MTPPDYPRSGWRPEALNQLERSLDGISPKTLSERLRRLEAEAIVTRRCFAEVPPRVEYSLTDKGHALVPVIDSMRAYGVAWLCPRHEGE